MNASSLIVQDELESLFDYYDYCSLLQEHTDLLSEFNKGMVACQNALVLKEVVSTYGETDAIVALIGQEGLLETAKNAIMTFVTWLKNMMKKFLSWIVRIVDAIYRRLKGIFGFQNGATEIEWDVDIVKLDGFVKNKLSHTVLNIPADVTADDVKDHFKKKIDELTNIIQTKQSKHTAYTLSRLKEHAELINDRIEIVVDDIEAGSVCINQLISQISKFEGKEISEQEFNGLKKTVADALTKLANVFSTNIFDKIEWYNANVSDLKNATEVVMEFIRQHARINSVLLGYLQELQKACTKAKAQIHLEFSFDPGFLNRVSEFFGGKLSASKIIVTNTAPDTWGDPITGKISGVGGWMHGRIHPVVLMINANYLLSMWHRWMHVGHSAGKSSYYTSKEDWLISTIVHECKHLFDYQNKGVIDDNSKVEYTHRAHESSARNAANKYEITNADRSWAKKIIDAVEAEVKKQKSAK